MRRTLRKLKYTFTENATIAIIGLVIGTVLSTLFSKYVDWFAIAIIVSIAFFILYYKSLERTGEMIKLLDHIYGKAKGDIVFIDDAAVFYAEGQKLIDDAETEILIYNDYFGQEKAILGFNTTEQYFEKLNKKIKDIASKDDFRYICMIGVDNSVPITLSDKFKAHLAKIKTIGTEENSQRFMPLQWVAERPFYFSFTIVDGIYLRIALEGIYKGVGGVKSRVVGGFIIKDNEEITKRFRDEFIAISRISVDVSSRT